MPEITSEEEDNYKTIDRSVASVEMQSSDSSGGKVSSGDEEEWVGDPSDTDTRETLHNRPINNSGSGEEVRIASVSTTPLKQEEDKEPESKCGCNKFTAKLFRWRVLEALFRKGENKKAAFLYGFTKGVATVTDRIWPSLAIPLLVDMFASIHRKNADKTYWYHLLTGWKGGKLLYDPTFLTSVASNSYRFSATLLSLGAIIPVIQGIVQTQYLNREGHDETAMTLLSKSKREKIEILNTLMTKLDNETDNIKRIRILVKLGNIIHFYRKAKENTDDAKLRQGAIDAVRNSHKKSCDKKSCDKKSCAGALSGFYAGHLLWKVGYSMKPMRHIAAWLIYYALPVLYMKYYRVPLALFQGFARYVKQRRLETLCTQVENKTWHLMPETGEYECSICGDFDVYYRHVNESQACLDDFLKHTQPPQTLSTLLKRLQYFGISKLDLSRQNWVVDWTPQQLKDVLSAARLASRANLTQVDLSSLYPNIQSVSTQKAAVLAVFLRNTTVTEFALRYQQVAANETQVLLGSMNRTAIRELDLSGIKFDSDSVRYVSEAIGNLLGLDTLKMSQCGLDNTLLANVSFAMRNRTFKSVFLSGNQFGEEGLNLLSQSNVRIEENLDLSNNAFLGLNLSAVGELVARGPLKSLSMQSSRIADDGFISLIPYLRNSTLRLFDVSNNQISSLYMDEFSAMLNTTAIESLIFSNNPLSDEGVAYLGLGVSGAPTVTHLALSQVLLSDDGLQIFDKFMPASRLKVLDVSRNSITSVGMSDFSSVLPGSSLASIDFSGNNLGNTGVSAIAQVLLKSNITSVALNNVLMDHTGMASLAANIRGNKQLRFVDVGYNVIGSEAVKDFSNALSSSVVETVVLEATNINGEALLHFFFEAPKMQIKHAVFSNNALGKSFGLNASSLLITPISKPALLGDVEIKTALKYEVHHAKAVTSLIAVDLSNTQMDPSSARAICRVLPSTYININQLGMDANPTAPVDVVNCVVSSGHRLAPFRLFTFIRTLTALPSQNLLKLYRTAGSRGDLLCMSAKDNQYCFPHTHVESQRGSHAGFLDFFSTMCTSMSGPFELKHMLEYGIVLGAVFKEEIHNFLKPHMPKILKAMLHSYRRSSESLLLDDVLALAFRQQYADKMLVHDVVRTAKIGAKEKKPIHDITPGVVVKEKMSPQSAWGRCRNVGVGLAKLTCLYTASFVINRLSGVPNLGYCLLPVLANSQKIGSAFLTAYKKQGFLSALNKGFDAFAYSAPGGKIFEQQQQASIKR